MIFSFVRVFSNINMNININMNKNMNLFLYKLCITQFCKKTEVMKRGNNIDYIGLNKVF